MPDSLPVQGRQRRAWMGAAMVALTSAATPWVQAAEEEGAQRGSETPPQPETYAAISLEGLKLQREGSELLLSATLNWWLPEMVKDALLKGIPVHFIAEAQMFQERWYWSDKELLSAQRYMRLSYQPLTRRWRLYSGNRPFEGQGLGVALSDTFETLDDAVQAMQRIVRWRVGDAAELPTSGSAILQLRFRIDLSHFPRPLQIGALGRSDWNLLVTRREEVNLGQLQ